MSLSHDIVSATRHGMHDFSEHHPVILTLTGLGVFIAALFLVCRYILFA